MAAYSGQSPIARYTIHCPTSPNNRVALREIPPERSRQTWRGYKNAAPNIAPHAARAMPVHPRASSIHGPADAAFCDFELEEDWEVAVVDEADEGDDVDGAAVDAKESVTLSIAQNCWARFSAEGTLEPQLDATQV